jgi:hypothetical protein
MTRRLGELERLLGEARVTHRLPDVGEIGRPGTRPIQDAVWQSVSGDGTLIHFDLQKQADLAVTYTLVRNYLPPVEEENRAWARFSAIEHSPGPVSETLLANMMETLAEARFLTGRNNARAEQDFGSIAAHGIRPSYFMLFDREGGTRQQVLDQARERAICRPLMVDGKQVARG